MGGMNPEGILKFPEGDHVACVRKLIAAGADVNAVNESSETPLYLAVFRSKIAGILLEHGADPNKGQLTRTPLISAAFMGGAGCAEGLRSMELLVGAGADVNAQESGISNALATAGIFGCPQMIEFLIGHGAEVNARFANGETALGFYEALRNNSRRFHIHACRRRRPFTEHHADPPCWWNRLILETAVARTNKLRYRNPMGT